jgi:hypothetical protein
LFAANHPTTSERPLWVRNLRFPVKALAAKLRVVCRSTKSEGRSNPYFRTPRYGLLRCARNDDVAQSVRPIGATGKSLQSLSIPVRKNNPLAPSGKSAA